MRRFTRTLVALSAFTFAAGAVAPSAHAMSASGNGRVSVHLVNSGGDSQDIKVDGHIYMVNPHAGLDLKVPAGSIVYSVGKSARYQDGEKLITITPQMKDTTVYFNCDNCQVSGS